MSQEKSRAVAGQFDRDLNVELARYFGHKDAQTIIDNGSVEDVLDFIEIVAELAPRRHMYGRGSYEAIPDAQQTLNALFDRHRFAFELRDGEVRPITSPALSAAVIGPTLLAVRRPGWDQVDRSYREALLHLRREAETADALTSASSAVEAALKAVGMKGGTLSALAKDLAKADLLPSHTRSLLPLVVDLIERLEAWRSSEGDAHGKPPGSQEPSRAMAALAVHWAGSFLAFLASTTDGEAEQEDT